MRKRGIIIIICLALLLACSKGSGSSAGNSRTEPPETTEVRLAMNTSGHIFSLIAEEQGYFADEGIQVTYVLTKTDADAFAGIKDGTIDVASNSGTNLPLQYISEGLDLTIFGGYLLTGCMPIFGRSDAEWNGIEDLIGKTMACEPNLYAITGPLLDKGYDPLNEINWYETVDQMDRIKAVENGDADFGLVGTALNYEINSNPNIKILTYACEVLPDYSCCRVEALSSWVKENPNTVKALLRAWIRAMAYYDSHHEETVAMAVKQLNQSEEYVRAYLDNPRFDLNMDPMKKAVVRAWDYMDRLGLLEEEAKQIDINDHINTDLYKAALDECQKKHGEENPKFYETMQAQYSRNNQ